MKKSFKINELGRSMVEILGVLAVIGVLSFGGIQGYKYAMDKHRANDIVNEVNMRATDIWHLYQDGEKELPDSPEADAFPEYGERTQTGFEILVTSHPPVAFRTWVENVPSSVCQKVLQENLDDAIQGLKFVQVGDVDAENLTRYTGDIAICGESGTMNQMVFTSFLDEDGGAVPEGGNGNPNDNALEHCVEQDDCTGSCNASCNERTMRCEDSCTGTDNPYCKETESGGVCVKCTQRNHCTDLGKNYTCSDLTNECVEVPAKCVEGKEFRTKNGICVACDNASNFMVGLDKFAVPELEIEDDLTGLEQCNACANPNTRYSGTVDEETAYCSYACTKGYSFQTVNNGCVSCTDTEGYMIGNELVAQTQCLACTNHFWYRNPIWPNNHFCDTDKCQTGEFARFSSSENDSICESCKTEGCFNVGTSNNSMGNKNFFVNKCIACGNRFMQGSNCCKYCEQPEDAEAQIEICKTNPKDERCTRKWENTSGQCMSCSESGTNTFVGTDAVEGGTDTNGLGALCRACGRLVSEEGYCIPANANVCGEKQFLGLNGICYNCTDTGLIQIKSEEVSGCIKNCAGVTNNAIMFEGRRIINGVKSGVEIPYCVRNCAVKNYILDALWGGCITCTSSSKTENYKNGYQFPDLINECTSLCNASEPIRELSRNGYDCNIINCPLLSGNVKQLQSRDGACNSCNKTSHIQIANENYKYSTKESYVDQDKKRIELCENCGNRIFTNDTGWGRTYYPYCILVNPGVSGVCNNIDTVLPDNLLDDLKERSYAYLTNDTGLFRDTYGNCRQCTDKNRYYASKAQCNSCPNRRWSPNESECFYGLCEEKSQFLNASNSCVACTSKNVAVNPKKENLCGSCENRRMLTTGFEEQENWAGLCVEECAPGMWQGKNGTCYFANHAQTVEIGTDMDSRNLCTTAGREVVELLDGSDNVVGYECKLP